MPRRGDRIFDSRRHNVCGEARCDTLTESRPGASPLLRSVESFPYRCSRACHHYSFFANDLLFEATLVGMITCLGREKRAGGRKR